MPSKNQEHKLIYFRPSQITCLAIHQDQEPTEDQLRILFDAIERYLEGGRITWPPRTLSFPAPPAEEYKPLEEQATRPTSPFSIIFCDVENVDDNPLSLLELIITLDKELRDKDFAGLTLQAVSPNWLASGTPGQGTTGGPGSWPIPFRGVPNRAPYHFPQLLSQIAKAGLSGEGEGVDVAILDTAPCLHDLVEAYNEWQDRHPLIRTLLRPNSPLRIYPATHDELHRMGSVQSIGHEYKMTDHGLFAAGIVHTIAPRATIHLIEVLNPYGVGDLATIAGGLLKVVQDIYDPERPLVVNCSLVLNLPLVSKHCYAEPDSADFEFEQAILRMIETDPNPLESKRQAYALKDVCDLLEDLGRQVIAAAGNDWRDKGDRPHAPQARYPAAFYSAVGVGALPKVPVLTPTGRHRTSGYSNLADKPSRTGITTLGGEAGEGQGILGLYLGEFPSCEANCTKWAWWAGTSFATPILSGAIAAVLSGMPPAPPRTTQRAIDALYDVLHVILDDETDAQEDALHTTQDYPTL